MTLPQVLEALLFASPKPVTLGELRAVLRSAAEFTEEPLAAALARSREPDLAAAVDTAVSAAPVGGTVLVFATYTAMWSLHERLQSRSVKGAQA